VCELSLLARRERSFQHLGDDATADSDDYQHFEWNAAEVAFGRTSREFAQALVRNRTQRPVETRFSRDAESEARATLEHHGLYEAYFCRSLVHRVPLAISDILMSFPVCMLLLGTRRARTARALSNACGEGWRRGWKRDLMRQPQKKARQKHEQRQSFVSTVTLCALSATHAYATSLHTSTHTDHAARICLYHHVVDRGPPRTSTATRDVSLRVRRGGGSAPVSLSGSTA